MKRIFLFFSVLLVATIGGYFLWQKPSYITSTPPATDFIITQSVRALNHKKEGPISKITRLVVEKSARKLYAYHNADLIRSYSVALGFSPTGHKEKEGDGKTPEGLYHIVSKNSKSRYHLSLKISYPNATDTAHARQKGVSPGGDIMIHGLMKGLSLATPFHTLHDWTLGCIAVTNDEIEEIFTATPVGTPIEIKP
ncbi:MAG: L,D-transpeptidase family protein [Alphaproteobacteria bacterium]|nr:L,D-transpeptidase family protein [Alphaproteobacteria bacterium]